MITGEFYWCWLFSSVSTLHPSYKQICINLPDNSQKCWIVVLTLFFSVLTSLWTNHIPACITVREPAQESFWRAVPVCSTLTWCWLLEQCSDSNSWWFTVSASSNLINLHSTICNNHSQWPEGRVCCSDSEKIVFLVKSEHLRKSIPTRNGCSAVRGFQIMKNSHSNFEKGLKEEIFACANLFLLAYNIANDFMLRQWTVVWNPSMTWEFIKTMECVKQPRRSDIWMCCWGRRWRKRRRMHPPAF